ncbi:MAG: hypothetical protein IJ824_06570 [Alphaproteobacteria bacterium]|nr:hypothetical protein [Alphaproteobacteria bacterium]
MAKRIQQIATMTRSEAQRKQFAETRINRNKQMKRIHAGLILLNVGAAVIVSRSLGTTQFWLFCGFSAYSWFWYYQGYSSEVINEIDDGDIGNGLRYMFKSWLWAAGVFYLVWQCSAPPKS